MELKLTKRNIESTVIETLSDTPVTIIQGARQVGKSTLASMISENLISKSVSFDSDLVLMGAKENTSEFVNQFPEGLLVIDEVQRFPEIINAIKLSVDQNRKPGRFLLTGSANLFNLKGNTESLAGRAETIVLEPFSVGELSGVKEDFVSFLMKEDILGKLHEVRPYSREEYAQLIESGGYPDAQDRQGKRRDAFFENYLTRVLNHDAGELSGLMHLDRLDTLFKVFAGKASQIYVRASVARDVRIPESSMSGYVRLLEDLCLIHVLPSWGKNYINRAIDKPKIIVSDTGIASSVNGMNSSFLSNLENGVEFGPLVEAFVTNEILKQQTWSSTRFSAFYYRDKDDKEADLLLELRGGKIIALEIKASSSVSRNDLKGLKVLRDALGERFHCGVLLYTGTEVNTVGEKLYCVPISTLWQVN